MKTCTSAAQVGSQKHNWGQREGYCRGCTDSKKEAGEITRNVEGTGERMKGKKSEAEVVPPFLEGTENRVWGGGEGFINEDHEDIDLH